MGSGLGAWFWVKLFLTEVDCSGPLVSGYTEEDLGVRLGRPGQVTWYD